MRDIKKLKSAIWATTLFVMFLWFLELGKWAFGWQLRGLGVYPGELTGLIGVLTGPLIHGSVAHISANSIGLMILMPALIYGYPRSRWWVLGIVWILSGLGVWFWGRESYHFGASGLTHGIFFYLFFVSLFRRDKRSIGLMMIAFFMFGGMLMTIFPREPGISFEYHLFGGIGGLLSAIMFWRWDPKPKEKRYSWEQESSAPEQAGSELTDVEVNSDDELIGDLWKQSSPHSMERSEEQVEEGFGESGPPKPNGRPFHISRN
ncbi:rhomboid family intramembrane serine protease [Corallincola platygyrae]|uniref:Rhomboid family intramembrane serine protease n=1 Tax=Corallincola platygyrae TaxID=1193278 RepID=A0ABW4XJ64_9GAMM